MTRETSFRILLIEDNQGDSLLLREALRELPTPCTVTPMANAIDGMALLARLGTHVGEPKPHLIVLDINLPLLDGLSALELMRGSPAMRDLPVWVLTSSARPEDRERAEALEAVAFTVKPTTFAQYLGLAEEMAAWFAARGVAERRGEDAQRAGETAS